MILVLRNEKKMEKKQFDKFFLIEIKKIFSLMNKKCKKQ